MASHLSHMGSGLNQTLKSSPQAKASLSRSPVKSSNIDIKLKLKKIIGTTANSSSNFDFLESANCFAYTAGAIAVVATINEDRSLNQQFFHARPGVQFLKAVTPLYDPSTSLATSQGQRSRPANRSRDGGNVNCYFSLPNKDVTDSPADQKSSVRERSKATSCISLSRDGRLLAVGETGYKPRVLVFSVGVESMTNTPLNILSVHSFGIRCVAFSPDSQYLATLGEPNDGFLHVWSVNNRSGSMSLYASNKCTSNVRALVWLGSSLITLGTRHVKIWRIETVAQEVLPKKIADICVPYISESGKALAGRNCLLGSLLDQTFTDAVPISEDRAILCSEQGDICLLINTDLSPQFFKVAKTGFNINTLAIDSAKWLAAGGSGVMLYPIDDLLHMTPTACQQSSMQGVPGKIGTPLSQINAMAFMNRGLVTLNAEMSMELFEISKDELVKANVESFHKLSAHSAAIAGIQSISEPNKLQSQFFTWSADGTVFFWDCDGHCRKSVHIASDRSLDMVEFINELKIVRLCCNGKYLVSGDRLGTIKIIDISNQNLLCEVKAHLGEITDISIYERGTTVIIATSGRDRMIQLHQWNSNRLELIQTLDEHVGSVHRILFDANLTKLISCSSDRTIIVWDIVPREDQASYGLAFLKLRNIVLKSTSLSLAWTNVQNDTFVVSTNDRQIMKYNMHSANQLSRFKISDVDGEDSAALNSITQICLNEHDYITAGVSNTDKSVRIYDGCGRLLACEYGHTEGLTGVATIKCPKANGDISLITSGADGTLFLWDIISGRCERQSSLESRSLETPVDSTNISPARKGPLRRVLSSSEIARLQELRAAQDLRDNNNTRFPETSSRAQRPSKLSFSQTPDRKSCMLRQALDSPIRISGQVSDRRGSASSPTMKSTSTGTQEQSNGARSGLAATPSAHKSPNSEPRVGVTASTGDLNALLLATGQVCRNLHNYRKRLSTSQDALPSDHARELERELGLTAKAVAKKAARSETAMVKLLDEYSERLVGLLDEKIETSVARQLGKTDKQGGEEAR